MPDTDKTEPTLIEAIAYEICEAHPPHAHRPRCDCLHGYDHRQPPCADKMAQGRAAASVMLERINAAFEPCDIVIAQFGKFCETHQGPPEDCPQSALRAFADEHDLK